MTYMVLFANDVRQQFCLRIVPELIIARAGERISPQTEPQRRTYNHVVHGELIVTRANIQRRR